VKIKLQELNPGGNEKSSKKVNHAEGGLTTAVSVIR